MQLQYIQPGIPQYPQLCELGGLQLLLQPADRHDSWPCSPVARRQQPAIASVAATARWPPKAAPRLHVMHGCFPMVSKLTPGVRSIS